MDYKTIEDEIYDFNTTYFADVAYYADSNLDFIEDNQLYMPKHNYAVLVDFLNKTINNFAASDKQFLSSTLNKLKKDVNQLHELYNQTKESTSNILNLFNSEFINQSPTLSNYAKIILDKSAIKNINPEDAALLKHQKQNFLDLKEIYYQIFQDIFFEERQDLLRSLKLVINTKAYYLDKLLWENGKKSFRIIKHLQMKKMDAELNPIEYIKFISTFMRPYTKEYNYLQSCLKAYR